MELITNFKGVRNYFCLQCNGFHKKTYVLIYNEKEKRMEKISNPKSNFEKHKETAYLLSTSELFNRQFSKSWNRYNIKSHKESYGSKKQ